MEIKAVKEENSKLERRIMHMERLISTQAIREGTIVKGHKATEARYQEEIVYLTKLLRNQVLHSEEVHGGQCEHIQRTEDLAASL